MGIHATTIKITSCSTPYGNQRKITGFALSLTGSGNVLNALRQSEENHCPPWPILGTICSCSTPYGNQRKITASRRSVSFSDGTCAQRLTAIRGKSLDLPDTHSQKLRVLNALRQSEENHVMLDQIYARGGSAQRLTAIRGKSRFGHPRQAASDPVLNALRQSEENHYRSGLLQAE